MSKKSETRKPAEKKTTKTAPEPKAKAAPARAEAKKPAEAKPKKDVLPAAPAQEVTPAAAERTAPAQTATAAPGAPRTPDPRLPAAGTVLQKRDRRGAVRCECTVEADGIRYAGKVYRSLSAAAMAAAKDLGLTNKTQNGFVFWGLSKPPRPTRDPMVSLGRAWTRYHDQVLALLKGGVTDDNRVEVAATIAEHMQAIETLRAKVA